jgi:glutamate-1-semialdehyde 2,1-aminomutase
VNSHVRVLSPPGMDPPCRVRGKGSRVWDADGHEYLDYIGSCGPFILGHASASVVEVIGAAAENGTSFGASTSREADLAEISLS